MNRCMMLLSFNKRLMLVSVCCVKHLNFEKWQQLQWGKRDPLSPNVYVSMKHEHVVVIVIVAAVGYV